MKNITTKIMLFIAAVALCISINACKKTTTDSDLSTVEDNAQAESESNYIGSAADAAQATSANSAPRSTESQVFFPNCVSITRDSIAGKKTMIITFNNCTCFDGNKVRNGSIYVTWTGRYRDSGTVIHTYTNNYTVNGNPHNYSKWVTNLGHELYNDTLVPYFSVVDTATITFPQDNNATIKWTSSKEREWIRGYNVPAWEWWLTEYSITGSANGVDRKGLPFTVTITSPIIANFSCIWILVQGTYDVQVQGKAERIINYGNGSCNDNATCTIDGVVYNFQFANY